MTVIVQQDPFDPGKVLSAFTAKRVDAGAIVTFSGVVRDNDGQLESMLIEHYPAMTHSALEAIETEAVQRWDLADSLVLHRFGKLFPAEPIMMVITAARHRANAFEAAEFLMDYLKSRAPFWKKEIGKNGEEWVAARDEDETALRRW